MKKDLRWTAIWVLGMVCVGVWDTLFLNKPALRQVTAGFLNTFSVAFLAVGFTLLLAWGVTLALHFLDTGKNRAPYLLLTFLLNLIRSVPQVVGILFGYVAVSALVEAGFLRSPIVIFSLLALCISLFVFIEFVDLMRERIAHYQKLDFYNAMRVCGISEGRVVNFDILWKNSRIHVLNKLISVFGAAIFLQCSVDFIISVGLSTDVNSVTLPASLGSLLAKIDSKQDILAIGYTLTHPGYAQNLFFGHLLGLTVAFLIVFSLMSIYHIANGYAERHHL
ncbi:MAG TPA: ABC transporter permease subunit [Chitinivibrionales bacterium]|jgi:ABC-type dipeptide/oligopeptide/nickel transport system permease subunit|nr:ABC transporter permease subunit [Chitinivibrionales bacterium]